MIFSKTKITLFSVLLMLAVFGLVPNVAFAANRYWVGSAGGNTNSTANWSATSGNACGVGGGASVPTSTSDVFFKSECTNSATINATISVLSLTIDAGYTGTITQGSTKSLIFFGGNYSQAGGTVVLNGNGFGTSGSGTLTLSGGILTDNSSGGIGSNGLLTISGGALTGGSVATNAFAGFLLSSGSFTAGSGGLNVSGTFTKSGGTFTMGTNPVIINGTGNLTSGGASFYDLEIYDSTRTLVDTLSVTNNLTIDVDATLDVSGSNFGVTVGGTWSNSGTFTPHSGTLTLTGTSTFSDTTSFYNLTINGSGKTVTLGAALTTTNNLTITAGTLDVSAADCSAASCAVSVGANYSNAGTFTARTGTATLTSTGSGGQITSGSSNFYNLTQNGSGGTYTLQDALTVSNILTITAGTLQLSTFGLTSSGTTSISGTLNDNSATGTNLFVGAVTINSGGIWTETNNPAFTFRGGLTNNSSSGFTSGSGAYTFDTNAQTISGSQSFTITNLTNNVTSSTGLTFSGGQPTVTTLTQGSSAQLTFSGTVPTITTLTATASGNTVSYTSTAGAQTVNATTYVNLIIDKSGQTATLAGDTPVTNVLTITTGTLDASSRTITLSGTTGTPFVNSGSFTPSTSTVTYTGNNGSGNTTIANVTYNNLTLNNASETYILGAALDVDGTITISAGVLDVSGSNFGITAKSWTDTGSGTFTEGSGTVTFDVAGGTINSNETFENVTINHAGTTTLGAALDLDDTLTLSGGALDVSGSNFGITLKSWTDTGAGTFTEQSGTVTFDITGGTINSNEAFNSITINHAGTTNLGINTTATGTTTITSGTLDATASNFTLTTGVWSNSGTFTPRSGTLTLTDTGTLSDTTSFYNLTINASGKTVTLGAALTTTNNLTITAGTLDASAAGCSSASCNITVGKNWSNSGTFTARTGTVTLNGTSQTIVGSTTFYNFTKSVSSADTLTFPASATQTFASGGTVTLHGASGQLLILVSSSPATYWAMTVNGSQSVSYVNVTDSDASGGTAIAQANSTNSGHNLNWTFDTTAPTVSVGQDESKTAVFTKDATASDAGSGIASYLWTKTSGSGTITFGTATTEDTTITADTDGTYVIRLTVTDVIGNVGYDEFTLTWSTPVVSSGSTDTASGRGGRAVPFSVNPPMLTPPISPTIPPPTLLNPSLYLFTRYLGFGDKGEDVLKLQQLLLQLGYFPSNIIPNGNYGPTTVQSVKKFQQAYYINQTGNVGILTKNQLNKVQILKAIAQLQAELNLLLN